MAYLLDDPYIHLALAENLPGHLGINLSEATDSSSSILYPWLLVPFARYELLGTWAPLMLNYLSALLALLGMVRIAGQIGWLKNSRAPWLRSAALVALAAAVNLFSLVFIGMEHTLHLACVLALLSGLIDRVEGRALPRWFWLAFFIAPLLRYEALALNGLIMLWLLYDRDWRNLGLALLLLIPPQILQTAYLYSYGLPALPSSVLYRSSTIAFQLEEHNSVRLLAGVLFDFTKNVEEWGGFWTLIYIMVLLFFAIIRKANERRLALVMILASIAHILLGRFGWYARYHAYLYAADILTIAYLLHWNTASLAKRAALITLIAVTSIQSLWLAYVLPRAAQQVYEQPLQLSRLRDYWQAPILAIDVGAVSWLNKNDVIDVLGLSSEKVRQISLTQPNNILTEAYLQYLATLYKVDLALMFGKIGAIVPKHWIEVATLQLSTKGIILPQSVKIYAINQAALPSVLAAAQSWSATLPPSVIFGINNALAPAIAQ